MVAFDEARRRTHPNLAIACGLKTDAMVAAPWCVEGFRTYGRPADRLIASTSCTTVSSMSTNMCFDEAAKQRNTSGNIYHDIRSCAMMYFCRN